MTKHIYSKRSTELSIGFLVALVDICTVNNAVATITVGGIAKQTGDKFDIDHRKTASIWDTFSCCAGLIPYGASFPIAGEFAKWNPMEALPYQYDSLAIGTTVILSLIFRYPKRYL